MRILTAILAERHRRAGLYLEELDDHFLALKRGQDILARFISTHATIEQIHSLADAYIEANRWLEFIELSKN